jgi:hypothetical protein
VLDGDSSHRRSEGHEGVWSKNKIFTPFSCSSW